MGITFYHMILLRNCLKDIILSQGSSCNYRHHLETNFYKAFLVASLVSLKLINTCTCLSYGQRMTIELQQYTIRVQRKFNYELRREHNINVLTKAEGKSVEVGMGNRDQTHLTFIQESGHDNLSQI